MRDQLTFEVEPFEAYPDLPEYEEEQPDAYSEFDEETGSFDTELDGDWVGEVRRGQRAPVRPGRFGVRPVRPIRPPLRPPWRPRPIQPVVPPFTPPPEPAPTAGVPAAAGPCVLFGDGSCVRCGSCETCERRIRAASPAQLVPVPNEFRATPGKKEAIQMDAQALDAYRKLYQDARVAGIGDSYLKITSGHRDYNRQADALWRPRLLKIFADFGCDPSTVKCVETAINATSRALRSLPVPHPPNTWANRFRQELQRVNCAVRCDPQRIQEVAQRKNVKLPRPDDAVDSAVRILRRGTAPPGGSPHHTGRAVDIFVGRAPGAPSSASTDRQHVQWQRAQAPYRWLVCNASRFGFYPYNAEPWHWEYNPTV